MTRKNIERIKQELVGDYQKRQDYIVFGEKERVAILEAEKITELPKSLVIAVACKFLVESLKQEDSNKDKKDGK